MITINENVIPYKGGDIKVETSGGTEIVKASASNNGGVPWWIIYVLIGWNALLTAGVVALALSRKNASGKKATEKEEFAE
ncbi:MAG: hypothetical protein J6Y21_06580 [Clostridia bacterium]|nr:hypothetical protein [Clostridia bacterium]